MDQLKDSFIYYYQKEKFNEDVHDPFRICSSQRKCLAQLYAASIASCCTDATCILLQEKLHDCANIVDCRDEGAVNNYADASLAVARHCKNESQKWTSSLKDAKMTIQKYLKPLDCKFADDGIPNRCSSWDITSEQVSKLLCSETENIESNREFISRDQLERQKFSNGFTAGRSSNFFGEGQPIGRADFQPKRPENNGVQYNMSNVSENSCSFGKLGFHGAKTVVSAAPPRKIMNDQDTGGSVFKKGFQSNTNNRQNPMVPTGSVGKESRGFVNNFFQPRGNNQNFIQQTCQETRGQPKNPMQQCGQETRGQPPGFFRTARDELGIQNMKKWGNRGGRGGGGGSVGSYNCPENSNNYGQKRSLGTRRGVMNKFVPPVRNESQNDFGRNQMHQEWEQNEEVDERLKNIDPKMIELIRSEIMDIGNTVTWDDIAGLEFAKSTIQEVVVWPLLRPDIFTGLRRPPKGILLFGPPGTGKTLIGKCIASQSHSTFFSISASSLTSKWIGDGEKMVRALFAVARCHQPAVVFIDEIDSLLTQRSDTEHESSRRIKTEFLVQLDGAATGEEDRILVIGATNRPQELDEAARRRLVKKLYIPLPELQARRQIIQRLMFEENNCLTEEEINEISVLTEGYSGADMKNLCQEASLGPIRSLGFADIQNIRPEEVRPVSIIDFKSALSRVRASVSPGDLDSYVQWDKTYGSGGATASGI